MNYYYVIYESEKYTLTQILLFFNIFLMLSYPYFFFTVKNDMDKLQRDREIVFYVVVVSIAVIKYYTDSYLTVTWHRLTFEVCNLVLFMTTYYIEQVQNYIKSVFFNFHTMTAKTMTVSNFKSMVQNNISVFKSALYVDYTYIFYVKYEMDVNGIYKPNSATSMVCKYDLVAMKRNDIQLNKGLYRLFSQVVMVTPDPKDVDNIYFYVIGGAEIKEKGKFFGYNVYDEITCLDKNYYNSKFSNFNMKKKRMCHRVILIDFNRVLILGGYNEEEKTMNSVEMVVLDKKDFLYSKLGGNIANMKNYIKQDNEEEEVNKFHETYLDMHECRQNFGITVLKSKEEGEKDPSQWLKVVVCGGWNGEQYLNSIEILDLKENIWDIYYCKDHSIVPSSNLCISSFLDLDSEEKEEMLVVFGGQSYESHSDIKKTMDVRDDNQECDLQSERDNWYELEVKDENMMDMSFSEVDRLKYFRSKYNPNLFADEEDPVEQEYKPLPRARVMLFETLSPSFKNRIITYEQRRGNWAFSNPLGIKHFNDDCCYYEIQEVNADRHIFMIKLVTGRDTPIFLKQANKAVHFVEGEANSKNKDFLWIINEADNCVKTVKGQYLSYEQEEVRLVNQPSEFTKILVDEREEKMVRLDCTDIINMVDMVKRNEGRKFKYFDRSFMRPCPELNFLTDHLLNGTMLQVGRETYWFASSDYFGRFSTTKNSWHFTKRMPEGLFYGGSTAYWFDDDYD